jgi:crotonobetainyl-CoA:carnitine CoA-transferase CaiB-like acyl-CoA transferase
LDILEPRFRLRPTSEWLGLLLSAGVPCAPVNDIAAALADVQVAARQGVIEIPHPVLGVVRQIATPFRIDDFTPPLACGPLRGDDTVAVLRDLCGYSDDAITALARDDVFGGLALDGEVGT